MNFKKFLTIKKAAQVASCVALMTLLSGKVMGQSWYGGCSVINGGSVIVSGCGTLGTLTPLNYLVVTPAPTLATASLGSGDSNVVTGSLNINGTLTLTPRRLEEASVFQVNGQDVTVDDYCNFLMAVAKNSDTYGLFADAMGEDTGSNGGPYIIRSGTPDNQSYAPVDGKRGEVMVGATLCDMARYCNWLQNGQPSGDQGPETTEKGAYLFIPIYDYQGDCIGFTSEPVFGATYSFSTAEETSPY